MNMNQFFRSLLFSIYFSIGVALYSTGCVLLLVAPLRYRHRLIRHFLKTTLRVLKKTCHLTYHLQGLEHIPKDRPVIILSKHQSTFETLLLPLIFHDPAMIVKRELLFVPFFGWGLAAASPIAINRAARSSAMQQVITKGKANLQHGRSILLFPEGTRTPFGKIGHYKLGGARLACATETPVIPVAHNAGKYWPKRQFLKQPGRIEVVIGPVIETKNKTPEEVTAMVKAWIEDTIQLI